MLNLLIGPVADLASTWLSGKVEEKKAQSATKVAMAQAEAVVMQKKATGEIDMDKFNVQGSSIAYGHPFAATGTRMITQMLNELNRRGGGTGLLTACAAGGLGAAMIVETE